MADCRQADGAGERVGCGGRRGAKGGGSGRSPFEWVGGLVGGFGTQKFVFQKWPDQIFPFVNLVFCRDGHFGLGGGGRGCWGRDPPWLLIILKTPWGGVHMHARGLGRVAGSHASAPSLPLSKHGHGPKNPGKTAVQRPPRAETSPCFRAM